MLSHPKCGASWEGLVVEETLRVVEPDQHHFWATHQGAELDLLLHKDGRRLSVEIKRSDAPTLTPSMRHALVDLELERLIVIYPGSQRYELAPRVTAVPAMVLADGDVRAPFDPRGCRSQPARNPAEVAPRPRQPRSAEPLGDE